MKICIVTIPLFAFVMYDHHCYNLMVFFENSTPLSMRFDVRFSISGVRRHSSIPQCSAVKIQTPREGARVLVVTIVAKSYIKVDNVVQLIER